MADKDSTGKARPVKKLKQQPLADCQAYTLLAKAIDITELAQAGFNELGALCQAIRHASDQHTNPYHLAGIGLFLADEWVDTLSGELEAIKAIRQPQS
jgi:hypothetical protein